MNRTIPFVVSALLLIILAAGCTGTPAEPAGSSEDGAFDNSLIVEVSAMDAVLTSTYLQMANLDMTFIDFTLTNPTGDPITVTVESEIPGYTEKSINTVMIPAHGNITVGQNPPLRPGAVPREMTPAALRYRVAYSSGNLIEEQTVPVKIYARDTMIWGVNDGEEWNDMTPFIAAWVTPHADGIDTLVRRAAEYHPERSMSGYQCGTDCTDDDWEGYTNAQVEAIYTALKNDYRITYINSPIAYGKSSENPQRVRLPAESLASGSANCIDGAVLYAAALESIGLNPHLIITPDHAFVCYETAPDTGRVTCLETTMTGSAPFSDAIAAGMEAYHEEIASGNFASGKSQELVVASLRGEGILPMA
jgi:hypothetical protein